MRWIDVITVVGIISSSYAQKYDTSGAITLNIASSATVSCGGCNIDIHNFDLQWYDQAYTHLAATIVKYVNNATNVTTTSTISGSSFSLPSSAAGDAVIVSDSVITSTIGGTLYTLTYPKKYQGVDGIERYSQSLVTIGNGTDRTVKCVVSKTALTHAFIYREDISNGLELSAFVDRVIDKGCVREDVSPPGILVRVSSITATTTNYVNGLESRTSAAEKASPSTPLSPPTVPRTSSTRLNNRPTVIANPPPRNTATLPSIDTKSAPAEPASSEPADSASSVATPLKPENPTGTENSDAGLISSHGLPTSVKPQESSNGNPASQPAVPTPTALVLQASTPAHNLQPFVAAGLTFTPSQPEPSPEQKNSASFVASDINVSPVNPSPAPSKPNPGPVQPEPKPVVVGGLTLNPVAPSPASILPSLQNSILQEPPKPVGSEPTAFSIAGTTIFRGGQGVTVSGTLVSLGSSGLVIGTSTIPLIPVSIPAISPIVSPNPTGFSVAGTFITPGAVITISGTPVSLGSSNLVIGTQTVPLPSVPPPSTFSIGGETFTANPTGFPIHGTTILPNRPAVIVSGTPVSLGASALVIGTKTIALTPASSFPIITIAGSTITANPTGFSIGTQTISPLGAPVTISGTRLSLGSSALVIGTKTIALTPASSFPIITIAGSTITANPTGFSIGTHTISPLGAPVTISGTRLSLGSSALVIGTHTIPFSPSASILTVNDQAFTAIPSGFAIAGTEIHPGGAPVTISGTPISLGASALVIGSSTVPLVSVTGGVGPAILSGLGITVSPTSATGSGNGNGNGSAAGSGNGSGSGNGNGSVPFTGAQGRVETPGSALLASLWIGMLVLGCAGMRDEA